MTDELQKKVDRAVKLIRQAGRDGMTVEVAYSGGKDSDVILELTRMAGIKYRAIYKNTTIDPPGTIAGDQPLRCAQKPERHFVRRRFAVGKQDGRVRPFHRLLVQL